jgi:tripartite-type tricarboxylate transporter receptor subunit TctC
MRPFLPTIRPLVAAVVFGLVPLAAWAQSYPQKPITIIVPYPPGATTDITARTVGEKLHASLGQPVIVDNRSGASGNIGSSLAARSAPDGYTLVLGTDATHATNVFLFKNPGFDPVKDFAPITLAVRNIIGLAVNPAVPASSVRELIGYAKTHPNALAFGSSGTGSPHHLAGELLKQMAGIQMVHVPYRGGGPAVADLLGGQIPMAFLSLAAVVPQAKAGKIKLLAILEGERYPPLPDVPTVAETVPGVEISSWLGFFAPAGTPASIIDILNHEIVKALKAPDVMEKLEPLGLAVVGNAPAEFAAIVKSDLKRRGEIIRASGLEAE